MLKLDIGDEEILAAAKTLSRLRLSMEKRASNAGSWCWPLRLTEILQFLRAVVSVRLKPAALLG